MEIATLDLPKSGGTNLLVLPLLKVPPLAPSPTLLSMVCGKYFFFGTSHTKVQITV